MNVRLVPWDVTKTPWPIETESVQTIVTSPPYWGLRDYGVAGQLGLEPDVGEYVDRVLDVFREARRVLRDDGTLWLNLGDTHYTAKGAAWNPGGGAVSYHRRMKEVGAFPAGRSAPNRMLPRGRARLLGLKPGDLVGVPWRVALAMQADGWVLRSDVVWSKPNPMPESVQNRPTRSHEYLFLFTKRRAYFSAFSAIRESLSAGTIERLSQPNFDGQTGGPKDPGPDSNRSQRKAAENLRRSLSIPTGWDTRPGAHDELSGRYRHDVARITSQTSANRVWSDPESRARILEQGRNPRTVWEISAEPFPGAHFATFPTELVRRCVLAGTSDKGACVECGAAWRRTRAGEWRPRCECPTSDVRPCVVLDPFAGAGTTPLVADRLGRAAIGLELKPEYLELARRRIESDAPMFASVEVEKQEQGTLEL